MDAIMQPLRLTLAYANACCGVALNVVGVYAGKGITVTPVNGLFPPGTGPDPVDIPITSIGGGGGGCFSAPRTSVSSVPDEGERLRYQRDGVGGVSVGGVSVGGDAAGRRPPATATAPVSAAAAAAAAVAACEAAAQQQSRASAASSSSATMRHSDLGVGGGAAWSTSAARPKGGGGEPGGGGGSSSSMHTTLYDIPFPATAPAEAKFSRSASMASVASIGLEGDASLSHHALSFDLDGAGPDGFFHLGSKTDLAVAATASTAEQQPGEGGGKD
ncbi:unnamed protein product [Ectocarpus sp. 8 AP-2014]